MFTSVLATSVVGLYILSLTLYRLFFHPLSSVPGPLLARVTNLWLYYHSWKGDEATQTAKLHQKYGSVLRIAPNEIDINDGEALFPIYSAKGGFIKSKSYRNFAVGGHLTIFSTSDVDHRKHRAKVVSGMFANSSIYAKSDKLCQLTDVFVKKVQESAKIGRPVDILHHARVLALSSLTSYLFGKTHSVPAEKAVETARYFYFPHWLLNLIDLVGDKLQSHEKAAKLLADVDLFATNLVESVGEKDDTYQARLLNAGFSKHEVKLQCLDVIFAGTHSTGTAMAAIVWHLAANPSIYSRLWQELHDNNVAPELLQGLPYLRAVINEGLRLAFANPIRLPRVVPLGGWQFGGHDFPGGSVVGIGSMQLFVQDHVFSDPYTFNPERWLRSTPEMQRDFVPFSLGPRQCIARNLAMAELLIAVAGVVRSDVLRGARRVNDRMEILEWFNSKTKGDKIELVWETEV